MKTRSSRRSVPATVRRRPVVAVLGAGIMGGSAALFLSRRKVRSVLIDAAPAPFCGASRWNEGKVHLGYLYAADATLATARLLMTGGLSFPALVGELLDRPIGAEACTDHNDTYLIHRDSVTDADRAFRMAQQVSDLTLAHPDAGGYFVDLGANRPRQLGRRELETRCDTEQIRAGYEVAERSVSTRLLADEYVAALKADGRIEPRMQRRVRGVRRREGRRRGWLIETTAPDGRAETLGPFDAVVNALWEGRGAVDAAAGILPAAPWTHRFRVSVFARARRRVDLRSAVVAVGPFGDVKNYDGRNLYLSWYETGLLLESHELRPPAAPAPGEEARARIAGETLARLGRVLTGVAGLREELASVDVRGGWVYAAGRGPLDDPASGLHRRDRIGAVAKEGYFSVDTGKYSMAPWIARDVAQAVCDTLAS